MHWKLSELCSKCLRSKRIHVEPRSNPPTRQSLSARPSHWTSQTSREGTGWWNLVSSWLARVDVDFFIDCKVTPISFNAIFSTNTHLSLIKLNYFFIFKMAPDTLWLKTGSNDYALFFSLLTKTFSYYTTVLVVVWAIRAINFVVWRELMTRG